MAISKIKLNSCNVELWAIFSKITLYIPLNPTQLIWCLGKSVLVDFWVERGKVSSLGAGLGLRS
jgi:hypothetical protein